MAFLYDLGAAVIFMNVILLLKTQIETDNKISSEKRFIQGCCHADRKQFSPGDRRRGQIMSLKKAHNLEIECGL